MNKVFIETDFPIKAVSAEGAREKNIRHGHISTLHIWWARRPLVVSRATIYVSLILKEAVGVVSYMIYVIKVWRKKQ